MLKVFRKILSFVFIHPYTNVNSVIEDSYHMSIFLSNHSNVTSYFLFPSFVCQVFILTLCFKDNGNILIVFRKIPPIWLIVFSISRETKLIKSCKLTYPLSDSLLMVIKAKGFFRLATNLVFCF